MRLLANSTRRTTHSSQPAVEALEQRRFLSASSNASGLTPADVKWLKETDSSEVMEVQLGTYAQQHAVTGAVQNFGARMVQDHSHSDQQLHDVADSLGVTLPHKLNAKDQADVDKLTRFTGAEFDQKYSRFMVGDHHDDIKSFKIEGRRTHNAAIKAFVQQNLPVLRTHLQLAIQTRAEVRTLQGSSGGGTGSGSPFAAGRALGFGAFLQHEA